MEYNKDKVDEIVMALLSLNMFEHHGIVSAWKGQDFEVLDRLHEKGWIHNPKSKAKSVVETEEGKKSAEELFKEHLAV